MFHTPVLKIKNLKCFAPPIFMKFEYASYPGRWLSKMFHIPSKFQLHTLTFFDKRSHDFLIVSIESRIYVSNLTWVYPIVKNFLECASKNGSRGIQFQANLFVISFFQDLTWVMEKSKFMEYLGNDQHRQGGADYFFEEKGDKGSWKVDFPPIFP